MRRRINDAKTRKMAIGTRSLSPEARMSYLEEEFLAMSTETIRTQLLGKDFTKLNRVKVEFKVINQ